MRLQRHQHSNMDNLTHDSFFSRQFVWLKGGATLYVIALLLCHAVLPSPLIWEIAAFFSIAMNLTYPYAAWRQSQALVSEGVMAMFLVLLSGAGLWVSPLWVIAAIFLHGCWDVAKYQGVGTPFFTWYTLGCVAVDWTYSLVLLVYYWRH